MFFIVNLQRAMASSTSLLSAIIDETRAGSLRPREAPAPPKVEAQLKAQPKAEPQPASKAAPKPSPKSAHSAKGEEAVTAALEKPQAPSPAEAERVAANLSLLLSVGEECVSEAELQNLLLKKPSFVLYDGFEPSGRMHIAQGIFKAMNVNKCTTAGGTFIFWVADWFALMNDKMGGDLDRIKVVGEYLIQVHLPSGSQ